MTWSTTRHRDDSGSDRSNLRSQQTNGTDGDDNGGRDNISCSDQVKKDFPQTRACGEVPSWIK